MKTYPISVPRKYYRGRLASRRGRVDEYNRVAARVEKHINDEVAKWPDDEFGALCSAKIAIILREEDRLVHEIIFSVDCGSNGVTILKGDYERAWAKRNPPSEAASAA